MSSPSLLLLTAAKPAEWPSQVLILLTVRAAQDQDHWGAVCQRIQVGYRDGGADRIPKRRWRRNSSRACSGTRVRLGIPTCCGASGSAKFGDSWKMKSKAEKLSKDNGEFGEEVVGCVI